MNTQDALNAAKAAVGNMTDNLKDQFGNLKEHVIDKSEEGKEKTDSMIDKAKGFASSALKKGSEILDGLADRIS